MDKKLIEVLPLIASELDLGDILSIAALNHAFHDYVFSENSIWRSLYVKDYGDVWMLYNTLVKDCSFFSDISSPFSKEPDDFYATFKNRRLSMEKEFVFDLERLERASRIIEDYNQGETIKEKLYVAVNDLFQIVSDCPMAVNAYCQLSIVSFILNNHQSALKFLTVAESIEENLEYKENTEFIQLMKERISNMKRVSLDQANLLEQVDDDDGTCYEPSLLFREAISDIFKALDVDKDGILSLAEFQTHLSKTSTNIINGELFRVICRQYNETEKDGIELEGFMNLYTEQALNYPEEVRKDLRLYGFDDNLLVKTMYTVPRVA